MTTEDCKALKAVTDVPGADTDFSIGGGGGGLLIN